MVVLTELTVCSTAIHYNCIEHLQLTCQRAITAETNVISCLRDKLLLRLSQRNRLYARWWTIIAESTNLAVFVIAGNYL